MHSNTIDNDTSTVLTEAFIPSSQRKMQTQSWSSFSRKIVITIAIILTTVAICSSITALLLPSWQVVHLFEYNSVHEHGLWLDCTRHSRDEIPMLRRYYTLTEPLNCVYKWDYDETVGTMGSTDDSSPVGEVNRHRFYGYQVATMIFLGLSLVSSIISICIGCCACMHRYMTIAYSAFTLINFFLSAIAEGLFFFYSHRADNRFINGIVGTYEQRVGLAFYIEAGSCAAHFVAFLLSILTTFLSFATSKSDYNECSSGISHLSVPNPQRSMGADQPLIYQQNRGPIVRPPSAHYTKYQGSYNKLPASSLPEFSTLSMRRGSETCV